MNLPKRRKAPKMGVRQPTGLVCDGHRKWVKGFECLIAGRLGHACIMPMHPHHVRKGTHTGMSQTPDDSVVVPLCLAAHEEVHKGHDTFEAKYGLNLSKIAEQLWARSPHRLKLRANERE